MKSRVLRIIVSLDVRHRASQNVIAGILRFAAAHPKWDVQMRDNHPSNDGFAADSDWRPDGLIIDGGWASRQGMRLLATPSLKGVIFVSALPPQAFRRTRLRIWRRRSSRSSQRHPLRPTAEGQATEDPAHGHHRTALDYRPLTGRQPRHPRLRLHPAPCRRGHLRRRSHPRRRRLGTPPGKKTSAQSSVTASATRSRIGGWIRSSGYSRIQHSQLTVSPDIAAFAAATI